MKYITEIEHTYVNQTYDKIASEFSHTRGYLWQGVLSFLNSIPSKSTILEIGSGNGKNLVHRLDCYPIAFDICGEFTTITQKKGIDSVLGSCIKIPMRSNSVDYILNVAVLHHLSTDQRRKSALEELIRILKPGGKMIIQVWSKKQPKKSRRIFTKSDEIVPWYNPAKTTKELRYYHIFDDNELKEMLEIYEDIKIDQYYWEFGNWISVCTKIK